MRKPILIVGGAGYIGSHCALALHEAGYLPVTLDSLTSGYRHFVQWGPLIIGDVRDVGCVSDVIRDHSPAAILHCASLIEVGESVKHPGRFYDVNVGGTLNLLETAIRHSINAVVFSSSAAVYGAPVNIPITEDAAIKPVNPYGTTKAVCEQMLADFGQAHGLRSIALRYFNACGARHQHDIGEAHDPETHLIPKILDTVLGVEDDVKVFGNDYPTHDGTCIRDYIHVADLADAHVAAIDQLLKGQPSATYNVGIGRGHSVREVVDTVGRVTGRPVPATILPRRSGDPAVLVADTARIQKELGWKALRPQLDRIVADAWAWHQRKASVLGAAAAAK